MLTNFSPCRKVLHRDLKTQNVFMTADGRGLQSSTSQLNLSRS
jgi:hypothetical protein